MFVAREIEELDASKDPAEGARFVIKGFVGSVGLDDQGLPEALQFNGGDVQVSPDANISEVPAAGNVVGIQGGITGGVFLADKIESEPDSTGKQGRIEFDVQGAITLIVNDDDGNPAEFVVDGNRLSLKTLTLLNGMLERGMVVQVAGIVSEGQLLASRIKQIKELP